MKVSVGVKDGTMLFWVWRLTTAAYDNDSWCHVEDCGIAIGDRRRM
jgi:hypothetical protein